MNFRSALMLNCHALGEKKKKKKKLKFHGSIVGSDFDQTIKSNRRRRGGFYPWKVFK